MNKFLSFLIQAWDPRPAFALHCSSLAEKYEQNLRASPSTDPQIVEFLVQERHRIFLLFSKLLPEFENRISIVITADVCVEHCGVFLWKNHVYILVSSALIGRPYDHPKDNGVKAWEWLARHEVAHIRNNHLPWLFYTRRLFLLTRKMCCVLAILLLPFTSHPQALTLLRPFLCLMGGSWLLQALVSVAFEWKADLFATLSIKDVVALEDAEKSLLRMKEQAIKRKPAPLGWILYTLRVVLFDPHPPLMARQWLLRRRIASLSKRSFAHLK